MKMADHYIVSGIDFGVGSTGQWCVREPEALVIFIHGFTGAAESTWHEFPMQIRDRSEFSESDVLFLGYNSTKGRAVPLARLLLQFIVELVKNPHEVANRYIYYDVSRSYFQYKKILIIGHSLGGALIRQIAIDLYETDPNDQLPIKIVLFAPAHKGSNAMDLADQFFLRGASSSFSRFFMSVALFRQPILQDLKTGSQFIRNLEAKTILLRQSGTKGRLVANLVCFGEHEEIVETADFADDPVSKTITGRKHNDVCKPRLRYTTPMDYVVDHLK